MQNFLLITLLAILLLTPFYILMKTSDNLAQRDCNRGLTQYCKYIPTNTK